MGESLTKSVRKIDRTTTANGWKQLSSDFESIAKKAPDNWYAQYYAAYSLIELAITSGKDIDPTCDRAEKYLEKAEKISNNHSENHVLRAYLLSARIKESPMMRGAKMGKESKKHLEAAMKANPDNPRYYFVRGMGMYYTPVVFGGGKKKAKPLLDKALAKYNSYKSKSDLDPTWGKDKTKALLTEY